MSNSELIMQDEEDKSVGQLCYEAVLGSMIDTFNKTDDPGLRSGIQQMINKFKADHPQYQPIKSNFDYDYKDAEVIEFTEVFRGGDNKKDSNPAISINNIQEAILYLKGGLIAGFEIGGCIGGRWSPVGVVRKWGNQEDFVMIKEINFFGQEGSGIYTSIDSDGAKKIIKRFLALATITPDSKLYVFRKKLGCPEPTEEECNPQFRAL